MHIDTACYRHFLDLPEGLCQLGSFESRLQDRMKHARDLLGTQL